MRRACSALLAALALTTAASCSPDGRYGVSIDGPQYTETGPLANSSEHLVRATFGADSTPHDLEDYEEMRYWVADARITEVIGQRPDAKRPLTAGMTVRIGALLLNSERSDKLDNFAELAREWPTEPDRPRAGDEVIAFLVSSDLAGAGPGYESVGQALLAPDGRVVMRGLPGPLNHDVVPLADVTSKIRARYDAPAPWRTG